jgi:polyhydroxyalkanoate synthesis regulator phasin
LKTQEQLTKSFAASDDMVKKFWDMWMVGLGSVTWTQEQMDVMGKKYLEQRQLARDESKKVIEELLKQVKTNQSQSQKMVQEAVGTLFATVETPFSTFYEDFLKKMQELSKAE